MKKTGAGRRSRRRSPLRIADPISLRLDDGELEDTRCLRVGFRDRSDHSEVIEILSIVSCLFLKSRGSEDAGCR